MSINSISGESRPGSRFSAQRFGSLILPGSILIVACLLRLAAMLIRDGNLTIDRDAYLAIARNLVDAGCFCSVSGQPTAFRPPLYPLYIAGRLKVGGRWLMGVGQVLMGTATVGATMLLADRCGFSRRVALLAGALVALDPLLIEYTTQAMTETLFTFLVNVLLLSLCRPEHARSPARVPSPDSAPSRNRVPWNDALSGLLFGLAALCRPSIWAFGLLSGVVWLVLGFRRSQTSSTTPKPAGRSFLADVVRSGIPFGLAALLILVPWVVRNFVVFSSPIVMTTHGGYTLLLGNNPTFYDEVVAGEGSRWSGDSLTAWQQRIARDLRRQDVAASDELARDNALNSRAVEWITNHPRRFLHACLFKLSRFWAVSPTAAAGIPSWLVFLVGAYYSVLFLGAVCGAVVHRRIWLRWWVLPVIVLSFSAVHSVYWSNTRMRSPVVPVVAIAAAAGSVTVWRSTKERAGNRREV